MRDSVAFAHWRERRRIPLTPQLLASAYRDAPARDVIGRARAARLEQDSSLIAYTAVSRERVTAGLGLHEATAGRLAFRTENAARIRWRRGVGAYVDVIGARTAIPMAFAGSRVIEDMLDIDAIPYFPGRESLLQFGGVQRVTRTDEGVFIHPLSEGAEAYYRYASGDSVIFALPDGRRIRLHEVRVEARQPRFDLIVGSLWFDAESGQLVRGAFRPSMPFDIVQFVNAVDGDGFGDVPKAVRPLIFPMQLTVAAFTVEYGLHEQRWWLPRSETVEGRVRVGFMHATFSAERAFRYESVNGTDSLPPIFAAVDTAGRRAAGDSMRHARRDSSRAARREARRRGAHVDDDDDDLRGLSCPAGDTLTKRERRIDGTLPVMVRIPCDTVALAHSSELPPSIFSSGEELFDRRDASALEQELSFGLQPGWSPLPPTVHYGLEGGLLRYNRVEALSAGVRVDRTFGAGYSGSALARIGIADWQPNGELHLERGDGHRTVGLTAYRRLVAANDWGEPLSVGASLSAVLWGRDEGFYYRTAGAELSGTRQGHGTFGWRLFAEQQVNAGVHTEWSLTHTFNGHDFIPNIRADHASEAGAALEYHDLFGLDPHGWRALLDTRLEGAGGTFTYGRGAMDLTLSHGLGAHLDGALTASAGSTVGSVPVQRLWYLGGVHTVRGLEAGTRSGDAYWLARGELGSSFVAARPTVFFDLGWAGPRAEFGHPGRPISGAGIGVSMLDGLIRFDVAHGIHPDHGLRVDLYTEARF